MNGFAGLCLAVFCIGSVLAMVVGGLVSLLDQQAGLIVAGSIVGWLAADLLLLFLRINPK